MAPSTVRVSRVATELRRRLRGGSPLTVGTNEERTAAHAAAWEARWEQYWNRLDARAPIRPAVRAGAPFLLGARDTFA
jgi:hypothetical protein